MLKKNEYLTKELNFIGSNIFPPATVVLKKIKELLNSFKDNNLSLKSQGI